MNFYELVFIFRQDLTPAQVDQQKNHYTQVINDFGGKVTKTELCGLRQMAYPIKKNNKGHYVLLNVAVSKEGINEVKRQMSISEDVLRYIVIRVKQLDNKPSALMQYKAFREETEKRISPSRSGLHSDVSREINVEEKSPASELSV
jgi:small subunit ribosomal protein S6